MKRTKKLFALLLAALMVLAIMPLASLAKGVETRANEAKRLGLIDEAWASIERVEAEAIARKATPAEVTLAAYKAALNNPLIDRDSLKMMNSEKFSFTVDGMRCMYYYTARMRDNEPTGSVEVFTSKTGNCAGALDVLLVGPYYGVQSTFTDQYKEEAQSIANATGGTVTLLSGSAATGPAITGNYLDKGVVIYDSHGTQEGDSSYLCLTSDSGITSTDYNNGWAVSGGSGAAYIDGRYVQNHVTGTLSNCLVWMAICEGMKKAGNGTTGTALLAAGAAAVYGYSQSVTFAGDYEYEATFWTEMKNGANVADALVEMKSVWGIPDPHGDAYPILMSPDDPFPTNPDSAQDVVCDWTLFSQDPVAIQSFEIKNSAGDIIDSLTLRQGKVANVKVGPNPNNANNYTVAWSVDDNAVITLTPSTNGKAATITAVAPGTATVTATITSELKTVLTDSIEVTVTEAPKWNPTDVIVPGEEYLIGFVVNGETYLAVNYNETASNNYYYSISSNYYGYTAPAVMSGLSVIGATGNATDIDYCTWIFSSSEGGVITSGSDSSRHLYIYSSTSYDDLYPNSSSSTWTYDAASHTLKAGSRYAAYYTNGTLNLMGAQNQVPTNGYIQLFSVSAEEPDPTATYYTVKFFNWDGTLLASQQVKEGNDAIAPTVPKRPGYTFVGWDTSFTNVQSDLNVTAVFTQNAPGSEVWVPTDTIVPGEEYLIAFVVNGQPYLAVNYNESADNHYYNSISYNYYGYTAPAGMSGENIIDVAGNADDLMYCTWIFTTGNGGLIQSGYESNRYLQGYSSTIYADLYPGESTSCEWTYNAENHTLYYVLNGSNRYAQYYSNNSDDLMGATSSVPTNGYVQLYTLTTITPPQPVTHTLTIEYVYEGGAQAADTYTATLEEGAEYEVESPVIEGYTPDMEVVSGVMGTEDITVTVVYTENEVPPVVVIGDVDCDGDVDFDDVTLLNAYLLNAAEISEQGLANANINGDDRVSSADVVALNKLILGNN